MFHFVFVQKDLKEGKAQRTEWSGWWMWGGGENCLPDVCCNPSTCSGKQNVSAQYPSLTSHLRSQSKLKNYSYPLPLFSYYAPRQNHPLLLFFKLLLPVLCSIPMTDTESRKKLFLGGKLGWCESCRRDSKYDARDHEMEGQNKRGERREGEHVQYTVVSTANVYCGLKD